MKRSKPKFNFDSELIALEVQRKDSRDIVFPIDRKFSRELNTWVYECELVTHLDDHLKSSDAPVPYPENSIVFVEEKNLRTLKIED
jgi:hypothetical protein